jgi:hypothetical protein
MPQGRILAQLAGKGKALTPKFTNDTKKASFVFFGVKAHISG